MKYGSVCSGIEAASTAWGKLGWEAEFFSEIEAFPSEVLKNHYPNVPNLGDMTTIIQHEKYGKRNSIDLLVGGTPCQSFSVAGWRKGMADERGNLALEFCRLADSIRPRWIVWENVPGVLSSNGGRDFHSIVEALSEVGYGVAWRVLDAQHFGLAQRRKRVFLVGYLGDWRPAQAVLLEPKSLLGDFEPSDKEGKKFTAYTQSSVGRKSTQQSKITSFREGGFGQYVEGVPGTLKASGGVLSGGSETFVVYENHGTDSRVKEVEKSPTMTARWGTGGNNVPFVQNISIKLSNTKARGRNINETGVGYTLDASGACNQGTMQNDKVRRLTPTECERLQGFPDDYTQIPWRGKEAEACPQSHRYKALGNSMAVPVMEWIGNRINLVEKIKNEKK